MGTKSWEGTQATQVTPNDPRGIPHHMVSCSVDKLEGKWERPLLWDWLGIDYWLGSIVQHLFSTFWVFFPFCFHSIKLPLSQPTNFIFYFPFLFAIPQEGVSEE